AGAVPLVLWTAYAATGALSATQVEAARLAGGERTVLHHALRHAAVPALLGAGLAGVLALSDAGPGEIVGLRTAASEILTSFAAQYDFNLAARQCLLLTALVGVLAVLVAWFAAPRLATELLTRQLRAVHQAHHRGIAGFAFTAFLFFLLAGLLTPLVGLTLPLAGGVAFRRAWGEVVRTTGNTLTYAAGAASVATLLGLALACCVGHQRRYRIICVGLALALFALPQALGALGLLRLAAEAPAWADVFLR